MPHQYRKLCHPHTRLSSVDKPCSTRVRVCCRTVYGCTSTAENGEQQVNFAFIDVCSVLASWHLDSNWSFLSRVVYVQVNIRCMHSRGLKTNPLSATFEERQRPTRKVAPKRNSQPSTESYLRFLSWFYFHKSMMYRQINLRENRSIETCSCDWPYESVVHVSLCPQLKKPRGRSATCIHIIAQPLTAAFSKWFLRSQLPIVCFDEIIPLGASRVRVRVRDKIRRHNYVEA